MTDMRDMRDTGQRRGATQPRCALRAGARAPGLLAALVVLLLGLAAAAPAPAATQDGTAGLLTIPLQTYAPAGEATTLDAYAGRVRVVNFWAPWCVPCRLEFPKLDALARRFADDGVVVLGVTAEPERRNIERFLEHTPASFPILLDTDTRLHRAVDLQVMPTTLLLNRKGQVVEVYRGFVPAEGLEALEADLARLREAS